MEGPLESVERYRSLLEINNAIISDLTEEALVRAIYACRRIIPNDRSAVFLPDVHQDVLRLFAIDSSIDSQRFVVGAAMDSNDSHAGWPLRHQPTGGCSRRGAGPGARESE
jgi:hypothetical protein